MQRFTELFTALDQTNRTSEKLAHLRQYFTEAPAVDATWALFFLSGQRLKRLINTNLLRQWTAEGSGLPLWLVEDCYDSVGDLAETMALLFPGTGLEQGSSLPLHTLIQDRLMPVYKWPDEKKREMLFETWKEMTTRQRFVWNKIITGGFRVGVSNTLVIRALADVAGLTPDVMAHRLTGTWSPTEESFKRLMSPTDTGVPDVAKSYPFYLAYPIEGSVTGLGLPAEWQVEWKWDGIRAQLIRRSNQTALWSRGEELVTERFPEITNAALLLPDGVALDGEVLAWQNDSPMPFGALQQRIGRKKVSDRLKAEVPVCFMVYDVLELDGSDVRSLPLGERRAKLEMLFQKLDTLGPLKLSPVLSSDSWETLSALFTESRERHVEGVMIKRRSSPYGVGREKGNWWKWKIDPYHLDAVLMYAQHGHGRRASLYTDYTFGVWKEKELVPVAKAYSGLTDEEIRKVDAFIRRHTTDRFGPVRVVKPELVFELAFEGIQLSTRHKSGIAVRFPRMSRWRHDKKPEEADSLASLKSLLPSGDYALS